MLERNKIIVKSMFLFHSSNTELNPSVSLGTQNGSSAPNKPKLEFYFKSITHVKVIYEAVTVDSVLMEHAATKLRDTTPQSLHTAAPYEPMLVHLTHSVTGADKTDLKF